MSDNEPFKRHPDDIKADLDKALKGQADIDPYTILWEIYDDIRDSFALALSSLAVGMKDSDIEPILSVVDQYVSTYYGDD